MNIRQETKNDYKSVEELTREAFWNVYIPGCSEHFIIHNLRKSKDFVPELSLIAEENNKIIGHIAYSLAKIITENGEEHEILTFGPLSVCPKMQNKGVGAELVKYSLTEAQKLGYSAVCIYGNPKYYYRFGFRCGEKFEIKTDDDKYAPALMTVELKDEALKNISGRFFPSVDFGYDEKEFEKFESAYSYKEKIETKSQKDFQFLSNLKY